MTNRSWRFYAEQAIREGFDEIKQREPEISNDDLARKISREYYPFGEREMHPYKMWLKCIREFRAHLSGATKARKPSDSRQEGLFE